METEIKTFEQMIARNDFCVLDTETTGLDYPAEVCEISIIDQTGKVLLDELIKPLGGIPEAATRIHGITKEMVAEKRGWREIWPDVKRVLAGRDLVVYNLGFDTRLMQWSCKLWGINYDPAWRSSWCAMLWYAEYWHEWDHRHGNYRYQRLGWAAEQQNLKAVDEHRALGDCKTTLALIDRVIRGYF